MWDSTTMSVPANTRLPQCVWIAVGGAGLSALAAVGFGIASLASGHGTFSVGIGIMLVAYGLILAFGAWLGWRRHPLARGLIVAPALLNLATALSLLQTDDPAQRVGAVMAAALLAATILAAVLPCKQRDRATPERLGPAT